MRLMSFSLTTPQILARTKTVTRRMGWQFDAMLLREREGRR
jgi:hypothetical protein